jgi:hypothetical protein
MDNLIVQALLWGGSGACLLMYLKRRRNRKMMQ